MDDAPVLMAASHLQQNGARLYSFFMLFHHLFTPILCKPPYVFYINTARLVRPAEEKHMDFIIAGVIAALLAGYLVHALLRPEKF